MSPFMLSRPSYLSVGAAAKSAEEVRERADAGQREGEVEPAILGDQEQRAWNVVFLVLNREPAALCVVEADPALLDDVAALDVPIEDIAAARAAAEQVQRRRRVDRVVGIGPDIRFAPAGGDLHGAVVARPIGADSLKRAVLLIELEANGGGRERRW